MSTELIVGTQAFDQLAGEWDSLASGAMTDTPFQTLAYQKAWWTHLHPEGAALLTVAVRDDAGALQAIGCFYNHAGHLYFNGCVEETDYLDLICKPEHARHGWEETLRCLDSLDSPAWTAFDLCNIPENSPTRTLLPEIAQHLNLTANEELYEVCPVIYLPDTFDAYLDSLDGKQRREISRKLRRAEAADVTTTVVGPDDDLDEAVDAFLDLLQKSTLEKRDWLNEGRRAVFHDVARAAHDAGTLQLMFTSVEGRRAAGLFNFDYKDRIWVYNSGLDPGQFSALSPGVVLTASSVEHAIELGRSEFDFLRGDEEYKYRMGAVDTRIFRLHLQRKDAE